MRNQPWVWPEVRDAGTSGAGAVPLRSAQLMGQQKNKTKKTPKKPHHCSFKPGCLCAGSIEDWGVGSVIVRQYLCLTSGNKDMLLFSILLHSA